MVKIKKEVIRQVERERNRKIALDCSESKKALIVKVKLPGKKEEAGKA